MLFGGVYPVKKRGTWAVAYLRVVTPFLWRSRLGAVDRNTTGAGLKLGKRPKATIRQLGYSSKNALKRWCLKYARRRPHFTQDQKAAALEHYRTHDRCVSATMRAWGYPGSATLSAWVREAFPEAQKATVGGVGPPRYPYALKKAGVVGLYNRKESAQALAEKLGVCRPTLYS